MSALALPFGLAGLAAAITSHAPPLEFVAPVVAVAALVSIACWSQVLRHWRDPEGPEDDDPWRRGGPGSTRPPDGDSDGPAVDWDAFEREFADYVAAWESASDGVLVATSDGSRPAAQAIASS